MFIKIGLLTKNDFDNAQTCEIIIFCNIHDNHPCQLHANPKKEGRVNRQFVCFNKCSLKNMNIQSIGLFMKLTKKS